MPDEDAKVADQAGAGAPKATADAAEVAGKVLTLTEEEFDKAAEEYAGRKHSKLVKDLQAAREEAKRAQALSEAANLSPEERQAFGQWPEYRTKLVDLLAADLPTLAQNQLKRSRTIAEFYEDLAAARADATRQKPSEMLAEKNGKKGAAKEPIVKPNGPSLAPRESVGDLSPKGFEAYWRDLRMGKQKPISNYITIQ